MTEKTHDPFRWFLEDGVAIIEVLTRELNDPEFAKELGLQLEAWLAARPADRVILNFHKTRFMSSTAFAYLFEFGRDAKQAGVRVVACGMNHQVRIGADVLSLSSIIPIADDEAGALRLLQENPPE